MLINIKDETLDDMFRAVLVADWMRVKQEVKELKEKEHLLPHQQEDLAYSKKIKKAYERIIRYVYTHDEAEEIIGKRKNK